MKSVGILLAEGSMLGPVSEVTQLPAGGRQQDYLSPPIERTYMGWGNLLQGEPFFPSPGVPKGDHKRIPPYPFLEMLEVFLPYSPPHHSNFPRVEQ